MAKIIQIDAAGAVLFKQASDGVFVALIFRKGKWDLAKGKREKGEEIKICAKRELEEELGIQEVNIHEELIQTYHEYHQFDKDFSKTTYWFVATAPEQRFNPQAEEDISDVVWFPLDEAIKKVDFENLVRVLEAFKNWLISKKMLMN